MSSRVERLVLMFGTFLNVLLFLASMPKSSETVAPSGAYGSLAQVVLQYLSSVIG